jgi:hypoxanthine-DNA glycosylase
MIKQGLPLLIHNDSKILILGTMPGERSIALQQYYGNKGNHFWKILYSVFNTPFSTDYQARVRLLRENHIALWNVLLHCEREGSADHAIRNEQPNDFDGLHEKYPEIRNVFFESKSAATYFKKYCSFKDGVSYSVLPSTSGLNAGMSYDSKLGEWKVLTQIACKND